ncbi:hypothetical protein M408DRAFT_325465 [Serendipita vermifera MAFF 305830]|uniref:Uncharacterized protein n=1 Tax=Serendipita vermifera MAFF 305830 TaxID=933852 RepID=A0A0C3BP65_SERVB|nr:hypothetical protein M408DRAFT_325465 [Serendipita vermifera MAFF 305830]
MTTVVSHQILKEKYFYPVTKGVYIGVDNLIPRDKTPAQMIMDRETCVVYLVDSNGSIFMQPAEMFPKEILYAPLWKTVPLPNVEFNRILTPPSTPPKQSIQQHAHQRGYVPSLATYTGTESPRWAETRHRRDSQPYSNAPSPHVRFVQPQPSGTYYVQPAAPTKSVRFAH